MVAFLRFVEPGKGGRLGACENLKGPHPRFQGSDRAGCDPEARCLICNDLAPFAVPISEGAMV
jgi:hypothetical protein